MSAGAARAFAPRPAERWRPTRDEALEALAEAREAIWEREATIAGLAMLAIQQREPPHDLRAERRVLGALLYGHATLEDVAAIEPADWYVTGHRELAAVLVELWTLAPGSRPAKQWERAHRVLARLRGGQEAALALDLLVDRPGCPRDEIVTVRALGRWRREHAR